MRIGVSFWLIAILFLGCHPPPQAAPTADGVAYLNARIYTLNSEQPWAEALVTSGDRIRFVGSSKQAQAMATEAGYRTIDLHGALVLPGLHDNHVHALESGSDSTHFELDGEQDAEQHAFIVAKAVEENPKAPWLIGFGHSLESLLEAQRSPLEILDEVAPDTPVIIMEQTSHSMWVNSAALQLAGITAETPDPAGGVILRDDGAANGILIDNAGNLVMDLALASTPERLENDFQTLVEQTLPEFAAYGITSFCDARTYWGRDHHKVWLRLLNEDKLTARVNLGLWAYPTREDGAQLATLKSLYRNQANEKLKINQIKLYCDGILHNTTAAMKKPYLVDLLGQVENNGLNYFTQQRLQKYIEELEPLGFDFHIHTIGNRGVQEALNAIERGSQGKGRHRLTHLELVDTDDLGRFKKLNVTADCQVAGDFTQPDHWSESADLIGAQQCKSVVPLKSLNEAEARITLSSDWNVSTLNPFVGLQNAVTRAPQNLSLEEAIRAYTLDSAYSMRHEDLVGSLEVGKKADFIVLNQDLFEVPPTTISETRVLMTIFDGELIYSGG